MKLLAVFDNLHYLIVGTDETINQLKFMRNHNVGFINQKDHLSKTYKNLSAYIRSLKIDHYKITEGDLRNYSDGLLK